MAAIRCLVSRHLNAKGERACRVLLEDGTTRVLDETQVMCMPKGDVALAAGPCTFDTSQPEPQTLSQGPPIGSVIRVCIHDKWMSCVVREAHSKLNQPVLYVTEYDDGMIIKDRLCAPWDFVLSSEPTGDASCRAIADAADYIPFAASEPSSPPSSSSDTEVVAQHSPSSSDFEVIDLKLAGFLGFKAVKYV